VPPTTKFVLLTLSTWSDKDGIARPAISTLVKDTGLHRRTVLDALVWLRREGVIKASEPRRGSPLRYRFPKAPVAQDRVADAETRSPEVAEDGNKVVAVDALPDQCGDDHQCGDGHEGNAPSPHGGSAATATQDLEQTQRKTRSSASQPKSIPPSVTQAVEIWNASKGNLMEVQEIPRYRSKLIRDALREFFQDDLEQWRSFVQRAARAPYLGGENDSGWRADIEFCLDPQKLTRIREGYYDPRHRPNETGLRTAL
jgi:hypothetical protein